MKINNTFKSKLYNYFVKRLGAYQYKNGWLRVPICPYCGRENKMGVNLSTYRTNCFRCGEHPSPAQFVMDVEGLDTYNELLNLLNNEDFKELTFREEKAELSEEKPVYLPEGFINVKYGESQLSNTIRNYLRGRGFSLSALSRQGIGYCNKGPLFGYVILPFYMGGKLRYYNARKVIGTGPRYRNPDKDITGLGKEFIIFNYDALNTYKSVFVCEGAFNALTMGERGIATMGKHISRYQLNMFIKSPCERFIILLDPDAKSEAIKLALELVPFKRVKVVILPENKDVNEIGLSSTLRLVYRTKYQCYSDLIKLKNSLKL